MPDALSDSSAFLIGVPAVLMVLAVAVFAVAVAKPGDNGDRKSIWGG